jgi:hypothetical protein
MTNQRRIHEDRQRESARVEAAMPHPGTVCASSSPNGKLHGVTVRDKSGRYGYAQLTTAQATRKLITQLEAVERKQLEAELPPDTKRSRELCGADSVLRGAE